MKPNELLEKIFDLLPEDKQTEYKILVELGNKEKIQDFITSILPDIDRIISNNLFNN